VWGSPQFAVLAFRYRLASAPGTFCLILEVPYGNHLNVPTAYDIQIRSSEEGVRLALGAVMASRRYSGCGIQMCYGFHHGVMLLIISKNVEVGSIGMLGLAASDLQPVRCAAIN
jgi:hypothetical protein